MNAMGTRASRTIATPERVTARPPVKSLGGKTGLLPELLARVPASFGTYHEPFVGGGALFWALAAAGRLREGAVLSDTSAPLMAVYTAVRDDVEGVISRLRGAKSTREEFERIRALGFDDENPAEVAARYIYLNKTCFNGLFRVNRSGAFNVPWGQRRNVNVLDEPNLRACAAVMRDVSVTLECRSFEQTLGAARRGDLVFFDSPYAPVKDDSFVAYQAAGFGRGDHARLRDAARALKGIGVHVIVTNSAAPLVRELYDGGFKVDVVHARRSVNSKGDGRGPVEELMIT